MYSRTQFARSPNNVFGFTLPEAACPRFLLPLANALFTFIFLCAPALRAQQTAANAIGRVEGNDISVEGGAGAASLGNGVPIGGAGNGQLLSFSVSNGSVVTVHVGQARMALAAGGQIDICGPAKFTVLESGGAITLALNFGRMRVQLPATTALRIYTPTIVATPLDIGGAVRDITVGLDLNNSMCVLSTSGAIRLEQQFSGEGLIVPQAGEFFLAGGNLVPVAGAPGSCECTAFVARTAPPPPPPLSQPVPAQNVPLAAMIPPVISAQPDVAPANTTIAEPVAPRNRVQVGTLAHANEMHPVPPPANNVEPPVPDITLPQYTVMLQPLMVTVTPSPLRPAEPAADVALLVRVARVAPEWEFSGHVDAPEFAVDMQRALGQKASTPQPQSIHPSQPAKKKRGFWGSLKNIFVGSDETRH
ncbi:MAG TPA: hypothetical protein VN881_12675 [Candidatus Acidoferrales bacterium]|nr:hypothetical protein [Candidatus Acidoferrales bacterium]